MGLEKVDMYSITDLYCGAGGMALGFEMAGFRSNGAWDQDPDSVATFNANRLSSPAIATNIRSPIGDPLGIQSIVVIGGPPCQGFSTLGSMNGIFKTDHRRSHVVTFISHVIQARPVVFVMENVPQLFNGDEWAAVEYMCIGEYRLRYGILDAYDFGVPQRRKRAVIIGSRREPIELPEATGIHKTVEDAWDNLPDNETDPLTFHRNITAKSYERYAAIPYGGNRFDLQKNRPDITPDCWLNKPTGTIDVMGRMLWEKPAPTIRTEFHKPEKGRYLHPVEDRPITHREAARLQTFPDSYKFCGKLTSVAHQIGNAVPPLLAYHIAKQVEAHLDRTYPEYAQLRNKTRSL